VPQLLSNEAFAGIALEEVLEDLWGRQKSKLAAHGGPPSARSVLMPSLRIRASSARTSRWRMLIVNQSSIVVDGNRLVASGHDSKSSRGARV